jgi:hypothetical protein
MTHDPLCFEFDNKDDDGFDHSLNSPFCYCELISMVRADERMVQYADHLVHDYERTGEAWESGYKMGKEHEREKIITEICMTQCLKHDYDEGMCYLSIEQIMDILEKK